MGKPAPAEWIEFVLMDRFKWTPDTVRALSLADGLRILTMLSAEALVQKSKQGER